MCIDEARQVGTVGTYLLGNLAHIYLGLQITFCRDPVLQFFFYLFMRQSFVCLYVRCFGLGVLVNGIVHHLVMNEVVEEADEDIIEKRNTNGKIDGNHPLGGKRHYGAEQTHYNSKKHALADPSDKTVHVVGMIVPYLLHCAAICFKEYPRQMTHVDKKPPCSGYEHPY